MGYTQEDAWQDEAYDRMVDEIIEAHREDIVGEYTAERTASYFASHPQLTAPAMDMQEEAQSLLAISPTASLTLSNTAVEIALRDIILKPIAFGLVHDDETGHLMAEVMVKNRQIVKLLFDILGRYGFDLSQSRQAPDARNMQSEIEETKEVRNRIVHRGERATTEQAEVSLGCAKKLLNDLYPALKDQFIT